MSNIPGGDEGIGCADLAKSTFVKTTVDRRYSAFLLRFEPFCRVQIPLISTTKNKTPRLGVFNFCGGDEVFPRRYNACGATVTI